MSVLSFFMKWRRKCSSVKLCRLQDSSFVFGDRQRVISPAGAGYERLFWFFLPRMLCSTDHLCHNKHWNRARVPSKRTQTYVFRLTMVHFFRVWLSCSAVSLKWNKQSYILYTSSLKGACHKLLYTFPYSVEKSSSALQPLSHFSNCCTALSTFSPGFKWFIFINDSEAKPPPLHHSDWLN